jgi:predicted double-glycine peptidase
MSTNIQAMSILALLAAAGLAAEAPQQTGAVPIPLNAGGSGSGGALLPKPVQSWKARKFNGVVRQQTDFSCGAAALATIFNHAFGKSTTEGQVLVNMMKVADPAIVREKGFSLLDMKRFVSAIGMKGEGFEVSFDALRELKVPGIVLINSRGYKHFVVIRRAGDEYIQVADPALGNRVMTRSQFEREWNGIVFVVLGEGYNPENALKNPPPPLSARRLFDQRSPVGDALPAEFDQISSASFAL